jgi:hypothetical protein
MSAQLVKTNKLIVLHETLLNGHTCIKRTGGCGNGLRVETQAIFDDDIIVDTITERTADHGVIIEDVLIKDGNICIPGTLQVDTIIEKTLDHGVLIEGVLLKDGLISVPTPGIASCIQNNILSTLVCANNDDTVTMLVNYQPSFRLSTTSIALGANAQTGIVSTTDNIMIGVNAGNTSMTLGRNIGMGSNALVANTIGTENIAIGYQSMINNTSGINNTSIGSNTGTSNVTGSGNTFLGHQADCIGVVSNAVCVGQNAKASWNGSVVLGNGITDIAGPSAGLFSFHRSPATPIINLAGWVAGTNELVEATTNATIPSLTVNNLTVTSSLNLLINNVSTVSTYFPLFTTGAGTMRPLNVDTLSFQYIIGAANFNSLNLGASIAIGTTNSNATAGFGNCIAIGTAANTGASSDNIMLGTNAGNGTMTGGQNIGIGTNVYTSGPTSGISNTSVGFSAMRDITTGYENCAFGILSLQALTTGHNNIAAGHAAMSNTTAASNNCAIGVRALQFCTGDFNCALGYQALINSSNSNIGIGYQAGQTITSGIKNIVIGDDANAAATSDNGIIIGTLAKSGPTSNSIMIGSSAGNLVMTGVHNIGLGSNTLNLITTGDNNTAIGFQAGNTLVSGSNNTCIGNGAQPSAISVSNEITLGNSSVTTVRSFGVYSWLSDRRDKKDIQPIDSVLDFVSKLRPVLFNWNMRDGGKLDVSDIGFIAQDIQMAQEMSKFTVPRLVHDANPEKLEISPGQLLPILVKAIQESLVMIENLNKRIEKL